MKKYLFVLMLITFSICAGEHMSKPRKNIRHKRAPQKQKPPKIDIFADQDTISLVKTAALDIFCQTLDPREPEINQKILAEFQGELETMFPNRDNL